MLGKAVHSLSRIGDELYLEPLKDGVRDWDAGMGADSVASGEPRLGVHSALQGDGGQVFRLSLFPLELLGHQLGPCLLKLHVYTEGTYSS